MAGTQYRGSEIKGVNEFMDDAKSLNSEREQEIGQHIGYRYDVNLVPDYKHITPYLSKYMEVMGWDDLNWLEDVHMGYEEGNAAVFDRNMLFDIPYLADWHKIGIRRQNLIDHNADYDYVVGGQIMIPKDGIKMGFSPKVSTVMTALTLLLRYI